MVPSWRKRARVLRAETTSSAKPLAAQAHDMTNRTHKLDPTSAKLQASTATIQSDIEAKLKQLAERQQAFKEKQVSRESLSL
eukprot:3485331-Pyramimonas_sp.AAC.1